MADVEGVNLKITADTGQAVKAVEQFTQATEQIKDKTVEVKLDGKMDSLGKLHKANGQFMTMGEKLAEKFSSSFMKSFANIAPSIDKAGQQIAAVTGKIDSYINRTVMAVVGAIGYVTKNALSIGGGFEAQMTNVKIISGATTQELDALTKKAREMGATLPITAKDAAQAMELLAQRGTKAHDILASVADVSALAISQNIDMATSADLIGTTITNFGLRVEDASKITDIFNNASNQSAMNISKLVAAMKYVGPAAGALEIPLEKAIAAMEAGANAGLTGEMIGTGLSMILTKLASNSHILGVETKKLDGSIRSLDEIFIDLAKKGMTASDANNIFGQRAGKTATALLRQAESLESYEKNVQKWGATQDAVTEKMKTWPNVWNAFQSALEEVHIEIFDQIKEQSKGAVSSIADFTRIFSDWMNRTQAAGKAFNGFLQGLGLDALKNFDLRKFLNKIDIDAVVKKFESFGYFIKYTANTFKTIYKWIRVPLQFLIDHLTLFSVINFWTWILGKGMSVTTNLVSLAGGFKTVYEALKLVTAAKILAGLDNLITLLSSPKLVIPAALGYGLYKIYDKASEAAELQIKNLEQRNSDIMTQFANRSVEFEFKLNARTGFEELPKEFDKASVDVQANIRQQNKILQEKFKGTFSQAIDDVKAKFPEFVDEFELMGDNVENILSQISKVLHGSQKDFDMLPKHMKYVAERMFELTKDTEDGLGINVMVSNMFKGFRRKIDEELNKNKGKIKADFISEDITSNLKNVLANLPAQIKDAQKLLGKGHFELTISANLEEAHKKINEFIEKISNERNTPKPIIEQKVYNDLSEQAAQGDRYAQLLVNTWEGATREIDNFINKAHDAISYLGASPQKFLPALNNMYKGVQKIEPVTGKVTEKFKALYDAGKQLGSLVFDNLTKRIQNIKKAMEGGFIDKSALEREYKNALSHITLQVQTELEPTRSQYKSQADYESVIASKVFSGMFELGGDVFAEKFKQQFGGQTGASIGHALAVYLQKELNGDNAPVFKVNGVKQETQQIKDRNNETFNLQQVAQSLDNLTAKFNNLNINIPTQEFNNAITPLVTSLERNTQSNAQTQIHDYTSSIAQVVSEIKILTGAVVAVENAIKAQPNNNSSESSTVDLAPVITLIQNLVQVNSSNGSQLLNAVNNLNNATTNNYNIEVNQTGFNVQKKSDADSLARTTANAIRSGLGNGGV